MKNRRLDRVVATEAAKRALWPADVVGKAVPKEPEKAALVREARLAVIQEARGMFMSNGEIARDLGYDPSFVRKLELGGPRSGPRQMSQPRGEQHPNAKLSDEQVEAILVSNLRADVLAERHGVTVSCISKIRSGKARGPRGTCSGRT